jgi:hypothetical protein
MAQRKVRAKVTESHTHTKKEEKENVAPIILDAGSRSKASIRRLKEGRGPLLREVDDLVQEIRTSSAASTGVVPVVIVYRQKRRRTSRLRIPSPLDLFRV